MPLGTELTQADFFHDEHWNAEMDRKFINLLADQALFDNFIPGTDNEAAISSAGAGVNRSFKKCFSLVYYRQRVKILEKRYRVFGRFMEASGVTYDTENNLLRASYPIWRELLREEWFGYAYQTWGDPNWDDLKIIFAPHCPVPSTDEDEAAD